MPPAPPTRFARAVRAAVLTAAALIGAGCIPDRITLDLRASDGRLDETVVLADTGAGFSAPKIAMIDVRGVIMDGPTPGLIGTGPNPVDSLVARLKKAEDDPNIRAVILRINSPGGTVSGSDTMHREVRRFRERTGKPVVASMGEVAASGGYYLALAADEIIAQPTTITGSVGVIMQTFNFSEGMARIGVQGRSVVSGENKALASPFEPAQERHYAILQGLVNEFYGVFRALVVERRPALRSEHLDDCTDGRVVSGADAARLGMVDSIGDLRDAFDAAKRLANVPTARLVKHHARGAAPRSAYAHTTLDTPDAAALLGANAGTTINLMQLNLGGASGAPTWAGFYYLWAPELVAP